MSDSRRFERRYLRGLRALGRWVSDPRSEDGVAHAFEAVFCLAGPTIERELKQFAAHPVGARLLEEKPDLLDFIADKGRMAAMPAGSFGRAYYDFMDRPNVADARAFAELAGIEKTCARLGWDGDVAWFMERMSHSHDLFHVLSGYGSDIAGEGAVIWFTYGQYPLPVLWGILGILAGVRPKVGWRRWHRYLLQAYRRGQECSPLACADYERLFPLPLEEVRRQLGITPIEQAHPREGLIVDYMGVPAAAGLK